MLLALTSGGCDAGVPIGGGPGQTGGFWVLQARDWSPVDELPVDLEADLVRQLETVKAAVLVPARINPYEGRTFAGLQGDGKLWEPKTVTLMVYRHGQGEPLLTVAVGPRRTQPGEPHGRVKVRGHDGAVSVDEVTGRVRYLTWSERGSLVTADLGADTSEEELGSVTKWLEGWRWLPPSE